MRIVNIFRRLINGVALSAFDIRREFAAVVSDLKDMVARTEARTAALAAAFLFFYTSY